MPGFPDFQQTPSWRGGPILDVVNTYPTGTTQLFRGSTASFASAYITCNLTAGQATLQVIHLTDPADSDGLRFDQWLLTTLTHLDVNIPLLGNATEIDLIVPAAQTATIGIAVVPSNVPVQHADYGWVKDWQTKGTTAVAAGATSTFQFDKIRPGQVMFYFNPSDATGNLIPKIVLQNSAGGVGGTLFAISPPTVTTTFTVAVPDQPWMAAIVNNDGVNPHSYSGALTYFNAG